MKFYLGRAFRQSRKLRCTKRLLVMNLLTICLLGACTQVFALGGHAQVVTLSKKNVSLQQVFREINRQTGLDFIYEMKMLKAARPVNIHVKNESVDKVLDICFDQQPFYYIRVGNSIILKEITVPKEAAYAELLAAVPVRGKVTDDSGQPLEGATVSVKGTNKAVKSDANGSFSIEAELNSVLVVSFVGFETVEVVIDNRSYVTILLNPNISAVDEVVVVGYGTEKKVNLTGAVSSINFESKEMTSRPFLNVSTALSGLASGVFVNQNNGAPSNNTATIKIRGTGTLNSGANPLVIIDGTPGDMNLINPNDIASISILKDASSAAIYGSRAANGVILITTKSGNNKGGKVVFNYDGYIGRTSPTKMFDIISDVGDYMTLVNRIQSNSGLTPSFSEERINEWRTNSKTDPIRYPNTAWYDVIVRPNYLTNNTFSARGGSEKINFYTSVGLFNNSGLVPKSGLTRYNFRNSLDYTVNNWLKLGHILTGNFSKHGPDITSSLFIVYYNPSILPRHPDGRYGGAMSSGLDTQGGNMLAEIDQNNGETNLQNYTEKVYGILTPVTGLTIIGDYFIDASISHSSYNYEPLDLWNFQTENKVLNSSAFHNSVSNSFSKTQRQVWDLYASYSRSLEKHNLKLMGGFNQEKWDYTYFNASKIDLISMDVPVLNAASNLPQAGGSGEAYRMRSYFGRLNYDFSGKYLFEANLRFDGSSRFSPQNRWGGFPSFSAGWLVSKEEFWRGALADKIDYFKVRTSWGKLGNNGISNYAWQNVYGVSNYSFNDAIAQGLTPTALVNTDLKWETTRVFDVGIDLELFNQLSASIDYYDKFSYGILTQLPIPNINGILSPPYVNAAQVDNKGFEFDLSYRAKINKLGIGIGVLGAYNKNMIVKYKGPDVREEVGPTPQVWTEGQPLGVFYMGSVDHIIQDQKEIDDLIAQGYTWTGTTPGPGDLLLKDNNGDKVFNNEDMIYNGNPNPLWTYGFNMNFNYKGFDFYLLGQGVAKVDKYVSGLTESLQAMIGGYGYPKRFLDSWTPENKSTTVPKIYTAGNSINNSENNDYFVSPGDYLRIKALQLGYSLPESLIKKAKLTRFRIYINLENYVTITRYRGMDPEADGYASGGSNPTNTYPLMKTASIGLSLSF